MKSEKVKGNIDSKENFFKEIGQYYTGISNNRIPNELLTAIVSKVTDHVFADYKRFWEQYPKSRIRYSKLKFEDLEHPFIHYLITDFLKVKDQTEYRNLSMILFKMNDAEFDEYEKRKHLYETK